MEQMRFLDGEQTDALEAMAKTGVFMLEGAPYMCVCVRPLEIVLLKLDRQTKQVILPTEYECVYYHRQHHQLKFGSKKTAGPVPYDDLLAAMFSSSPEAQQIKLREMLGCDSCKKDVHHINVPDVFYRTTVEIEDEYLRKHNVIPESAIERMKNQRPVKDLKYLIVHRPGKNKRNIPATTVRLERAGFYLKRVWDTFQPTQSLQHVDADVGRRLLQYYNHLQRDGVGRIRIFLDFTLEKNNQKASERTAEGGACSDPPPKVTDTSSAQKRLEDSERSVERYKTELMKTQKLKGSLSDEQLGSSRTKRSDPSAESSCWAGAGFCKSRGKEGHLPPLPESESDAESDASLNILADAASFSPNTKATASPSTKQPSFFLLEHWTICAPKRKKK